MRRWLEEWITRDPLDRPALANRVLELLAGVFGCLGSLEFKLYRHGFRKSRSLGLPTVSVGNIAVGGTGKTPFTIWLAATAARAGLRVVVINKNYGAPRPGIPRMVSDGRELLCAPGDVADEAWLTALSLLTGPIPRMDRYIPPRQLASDCPGRVAVLAGRDRFLTWQRFRHQLDADLLILDDAFQHFEVRRHCDIVLLDVEDPFGGDALLPVGRLREPVERLVRAQHLVLTGGKEIQGGERLQIRADLEQRLPSPWLWDVVFRPGSLHSFDGCRQLPLAQLRGSRLLSFCGLANPRRFHLTLDAWGVLHHHRLVFPDHASYDADIIAEIRRAAVGRQLIVTTAKDAVKLRRPDFADRLFVLEQEIEAPDALAGEAIRLARSADSLSGR